jgi:hypothetical protein
MGTKAAAVGGRAAAFEGKSRTSERTMMSKCRMPLTTFAWPCHAVHAVHLSANFLTVSAKAMW